MSTPRLEAFLAKIYVDEDARRRFLADPRGEALRAGLNDADVAALETMDLVGLELTVRSLTHKRAGRRKSIFRRWTLR